MFSQRTLLAREIGAALGMSDDRILGLAREGLIPFDIRGKKVRLFSLAEVRSLLAAMTVGKLVYRPGSRRGASVRARRAERVAGSEHVCSACRRRHPAEHYPPSAIRLENYVCRDCRAERKRAIRRRDGVPSREELAARHADTKARRSDDQARRRAERSARPRQTHEEMIARSVARQRERYNTDPTYQAQIKAKKIRRKHALHAARVEAVNREVVAERDGWRCGICGKQVTRATWSLDHIVPLSKGGAHTYANVTLAHRRCNSARGAGRLPVQIPLFAR